MTFTFDGLHRIVWLGPVAEAAVYSAGDLCSRHASTFKAPRNWEVRDMRRHVAHDPATAGAAAPSRHAAPSAPPAPRLPLEPAARVSSPRDRQPERRQERPAAAAAVPAIPCAAEAPALRADTPLLARAFRAANAG